MANSNFEGLDGPGVGDQDNDWLSRVLGKLVDHCEGDEESPTNRGGTGGADSIGPASPADDNNFDPRAIADRVLDNLGLRSNLATDLSDESLQREFPPAEPVASGAGAAGYRDMGTRSGIKPMVVQSVPAGVFVSPLGPFDQLVARTSIEHPQGDVSRLITEITLSPAQKPRSGAYVIAAFTVAGRAVPIRVPLTLTDHALPGRPAMYSLTGAATLLHRDVSTVQAITAVSLELSGLGGRR